MTERPWEGRVAFITGAATGIGLGVAQAFADAGMKLALNLLEHLRIDQAGHRNRDDFLIRLALARA